MRKYIVRVQYRKDIDKDDLVLTVKAKNNEDLERVINNEYQNCLDLIDGYEYEELKEFMFKKHYTFPLCGTWIGADWIKYNLDKIKKES